VSINLHILNADGTLDGSLKAINDAFNDARKTAIKRLSVDDVDIVFRNAPSFAIPELKVGGFTTDDGYCIYISLDAKKDFKSATIYPQLLHELHHAKRFQSQGWPQDLAGNLVSEGLACLFEEEETKERPIYTRLKLAENDIERAKKHFFDSGYNHDEWFFGTKNLPRWFGYAYGYQLCKDYSTKIKKSSAELVLISEKIIAKG